MVDFGEILEPSSRAFWDDFDYDISETNESDDKHFSLIEWEWYTEDKNEPSYASISTFYVIEGTGMQDFLESALIKRQRPIGGLKNKNVLMYHVQTRNQIILFSLENNLNISAVVAKYFKKFLEISEKVYTFSLQSKIHYKNEETKDVFNSLVIIRSINSEIDWITEIKSPNFITGIAAGVATIRFLNNQHYSCYIAYTDPLNELDAFIAKPILKLFQEIKIDCDTEYTSKYKDSSLLYM
ncbi:uncharacterized protein LOC129612644 [Condylostylus longicornis]|uniref:uncharacterized protein LOC129612644 n=1 Tax=Condylostylus longicornis TaxID=2530218 RepID=UPI00244E4D86|nr:uncharacterized protein LOC129612644 [Condylostylus longicornis]